MLASMIHREQAGLMQRQSQLDDETFTAALTTACLLMLAVACAAIAAFVLEHQRALSREQEADHRLQQLQAELLRVARLGTMGGMTTALGARTQPAARRGDQLSAAARGGCWSQRASGFAEDRLRARQGGAAGAARRRGDPAAARFRRPRRDRAHRRKPARDRRRRAGARLGGDARPPDRGDARSRPVGRSGDGRQGAAATGVPQSDPQRVRGDARPGQSAGSMSAASPPRTAWSR